MPKFTCFEGNLKLPLVLVRKTCSRYFFLQKKLELTVFSDLFVRFLNFKRITNGYRTAINRVLRLLKF